MGRRPLDQLSFEAIASVIRYAIASEAYRLRIRRPHATERMREYSIDRSEIVEALSGCCVTGKDLRGNWRYRAEGKTLEDGKRITVILEVGEEEEEGTELLVITVWAVTD